MAADMECLDIADYQILVHFPDDNHYRWHHRVLLHKIGGGRWVALTPDGDMEVIDLKEQEHKI